MAHAIVYADFNCPFCYALNERLIALGVENCVDWRCIEHAPDVSSRNCSAQEQTELASEVFNLRHRAPEVRVNLPLFRPNTALANRWLIACRQQLPPAQAQAFRRQVYRALWQQGHDISKPQVLEQIAAELGLGELKINHSEQLHQWQQQWLNGGFECRIPAMTQGCLTMSSSNSNSHSAERASLLGLPSMSALQAFMQGELKNFSGAAVCEMRHYQQLLVVGELARFWPFLERMAAEVNVRSVLDARALFEALDGDELPDLILLDVEDPAVTALTSCRKIKRSSRTGQIPVILFADELDPEEEVRAYQSDCSDFLCFTKAPEVITAHIQMQLHFKRSIDLLEQSARIDGLTRVFNRREFDHRIEQEWRRVQRSRSQLSLIMIDVDYFKRYNDQCGHLAGDDALRMVAEQIQAAVQRASDAVCRYGGEEFALLMPDTDCEGAAQVGEVIRERVEKLNIAPVADVAPRLTVSVGVACAEFDEVAGPEQLIEMADQALYKAKSLGRNLVHCAI